MVLAAIQQSGPSPSASPSWADYAAVAIAALAFLVSLSNRRTAKRALKLSEQQEARRESVLGLNLNDSVQTRRLSGERLLAFHLLVTNPTDRATSLVRAELHLTYAVDGMVAVVKVPHINSSDVNLPGIAPIRIPAPLGANDAVSGWFLFRVAEDLTGGQPIDRYDVVIRDVHDVEEALQVTVIREAPNEA